MKFSVQVEANDAEIRDLAADAARRGVVWGLQYIGQSVGEMTDQIFGGISPQASSQLASILQQVIASAQMRPQTGGLGPGGLGPGGPGPARHSSQARVVFYPPWARTPGQNQPPPGYVAGPFGPQPGGESYPGARVQPISGSGAEVKECFHIEETRQNEAGWACCRCASPNGLQRVECRTCGHKRCGAVVTPAPTREPAPQMPAPNEPAPYAPPTPLPDQPA